MEAFLFIVIWAVIACAIGAWAESKGRSGFGYGAMSFILSPLLPAIILLVVSDKKAEAAAEARRAVERQQEHERHLEEIRALRAPPAPPSPQVDSPVAGPAAGFADELERIAKLRQDGLVTEEEFAALKRKLLGV